MDSLGIPRVSTRDVVDIPYGFLKDSILYRVQREIDWDDRDP